MSIHQRLKYARQRVGLSQPAVGQRTGIGVSSLSDFERGEREPRLAQLQKLAEVYQRSISFFLEEGPLPVETVLWREKPESPTVEEVAATFLRLCEQYQNLEAWCAEKPARELPTAKASAETYTFEDAEELAYELRKALGLGERPGQCVLRVLEELYGVKVFHLRFDPSGCAACTVSEAFGRAVLLNSKNVRWRRNFDLAHELFHLLTWKLFRKASDGSSIIAGKREDMLANVFAGHFLMPTEPTKQAMNPLIRDNRLTFSELYDVARQFDVSVEALLWRVKDLYGFEKERIRLAIERYRTSAIVWETRDQGDPPRRPKRFVALAGKALQRAQMSVGRYAEYLGISRQEAMRFAEQEVPEDAAIEIANT